MATIGFRVDDVIMRENERSAVLVVEVTGGQLDVSVQLQFNTSSNTAQGQYTWQVCLCIHVMYCFPVAQSDFNSTSGTLTFGPGALQQTITIPIINDLRVELNETFNVQLMNAPLSITLNPAQATVTIIDDDGKREWLHPTLVFTSKTKKISKGNQKDVGMVEANKVHKQDKDCIQ